MRKIEITLALMNGKVHTLDGRRYEAVAVSNDTIVGLGTSSEIKSMCTSSTVKIDLKGAAVYPGFNDSHVHLLSYGLEMNSIQLSDTNSVDEIVKKSRMYIERERIRSGCWVIGSGWNQNRFKDKAQITKRDLDRISDQHPIYLTRVCGHVAVVNSLALEMLSVSDCLKVKGGSFEKDEKGELTGVLKENALDWLEERLPKSDQAVIEKALDQSVDAALKAGITSVQTSDLHSFESVQHMYETYMSLKCEGKVRIRINEQLYLPSKDLLQDFIENYYGQVCEDAFFQFGPLKLLTDGSLGARTAALSTGYSDDPDNRGVLIYKQDELDDLVCTAHKNGIQVFLHAIGDAAIKSSIDSIERAVSKYRISHRHRINHFQIGNPGLYDRMVRLGILADIQPVFLSSDWPIVEARVGKMRSNFSYAWKTMMDMGIPLSGGSDCPVESIDPLHGIYAAVTRTDLNEEPYKGWMPDQKLSVEEAIGLFTRGAAYATFDENRKGTLAEGKLADMVVLSEDLFEIDANDIKNVEVESTIVGGKIEYFNSK